MQCLYVFEKISIHLKIAVSTFRKVLGSDSITFIKFAIFDINQKSPF